MRHLPILLVVVCLFGCGKSEQPTPESSQPAAPEKKTQTKKKTKAKKLRVDAQALGVLIRQLRLKPSADPYVLLGQPPKVTISDEESSVLSRASRILAVSTPRKSDRLPLFVAAAEDKNPLIRRRALLMIRKSLASRMVHRSRSIPLLVERLKDPDMQVRIAAAIKLAQVSGGGGAVVTGLGQALRSEERLLRLAAVRALAAIGASAAAELLHGLRDPDSTVSAQAQAILSKITPPAKLADRLERMLGDSHPEVRYVAATLLCRASLKLDKTKATLLEGISRHPREALVLLGKTDIDDDALSKLMYEALMGDAKDGRDVVTQVLRSGRSAGGLLDRLARTLTSDDGSRRLKALEGLAGFGSSAVPALIGALVHSDAEVRKKASEALISIGAPAAPKLTVALSQGTSEARLAAALSLAQIRTLEAPKAIPQLTGALTHPDKRTRIKVAELLGQVGKDNVQVGAMLVRAAGKDRTLIATATASLKAWSAGPRLRLYDILAGGSTTYERWTAFRGWSELKQFDKLIGLLADTDRDLATATRRKLTINSGEDKRKAGEALVRGLGHSNEAIRVEAAHAITSIKPDRYLSTRTARQGYPVLISALSAKDLPVRRRAMTRLLLVQPPTTGILQGLGKVVAEEENTVLAALASTALKKLGAKARSATGALARGLSSATPSIRMRVLRALAAIGRSSRGIINNTAKRDSDAQVKKLAADLLKTLK